MYILNPRRFLRNFSSAMMGRTGSVRGLAVIEKSPIKCLELSFLLSTGIVI